MVLRIDLNIFIDTTLRFAKYFYRETAKNKTEQQMLTDEIHPPHSFQYPGHHEHT